MIPTTAPRDKTIRVREGSHRRENQVKKRLVEGWHKTIRFPEEERKYQLNEIEKEKAKLQSGWFCKKKKSNCVKRSKEIQSVISHRNRNEYP